MTASPAGPPVWKFGGTSVRDAERMRGVAGLVAASPEAPAVVVSAMSGVTDALVETTDAILRGEPPGRLREIEERHLAALAEIEGSGPERDAAADDVRSVIAALADLADDGSWRTRPAELNDRVVSAGEDLSSRLLVRALSAAGVQARRVDAREVVRTDERFGSARPDSDAVRRLAAERIRPLLDEGIAVVTQGFVGATADGRTTTLGRGGSDYSAAILGAALDTPEVQVWTDVDGILSGDPRAVDNPRILEEIGYEEAVELSYFGAKVIHPGAAKHAISLGVPLRVRNTFNPDGPGTLILHDRRGAAEIAAVAWKPGVVLLKVRSHPSALPYGFLARVFGVLTRHELPVDLVATSHSSTAFTIDQAQSLHAVTEELSDFADVTVTRDLATVTVVGHGLMEEPGVDALVFWEVEKTPVHLISQASDVSLSFVVDAGDAPGLVHRLHLALIELRDEEGRRRIE